MADKPQDPHATTGYVNEQYAIDLIKAAGFKLVARSEINANPRDTKDYEQGVWTLPPIYRLGDRDREKYAGDRRERPLHAEVQETLSGRRASSAHHICLRRDATSIVPDSADVSSIFTSVFDPWNVCSSKHLMTFSVRKRLRPP